MGYFGKQKNNMHFIMFLISYFCKDFRNLFATQTYDNLPHPHHRLSAKLKLPVVSHTFTQQTFNIYRYIYTHSLSHTHIHTSAVLQKDQAQSSSVSLSCTHTHTHTHTHMHTRTVIQFMTAKTTQCRVKATCTRTLVIVHILTQKYKAMGRISNKKCT